MRDAQDAEDKRLLETGDTEELLAKYVYEVRQRLYLRLRDRDAADEIAQRVFLRLWEELSRRNTYGVPFRVVVWNVVRWTAAGYEWRTKLDGSLPEGRDPPEEDDPIEQWASEHDLRLLLAELPPGQRAVAELIYLEGLGHEQVAQRLGITRNAVDQRLHNAHSALAERLRG
jgi:RNA polymerase sigma factor (sigma-70 family)